MVAHFKIEAGRVPVHEITRENVETLLGRRPPWFRKGQARGDDRHYAVCPNCDNPIQLKGVYTRKENSPRPHGSHTGKAEQGFPHFSEVDLEFCPYRLKRRSHNKHARRELGPAATQLIDLAINEFDRIVLLLRDDFGFDFSNPFAERLLDQWFDSKGYLYTGAHLRNLPWIIAYLGPAQSLYGQFIGGNLDLTNEIVRRVPQAAITARCQLKFKTWCRLDLQCLHHRISREVEATSDLIEQMTLRVQDFTRTNVPAKAPTIYKKEIVFDPDRFERLMNTPANRAKRNEPLLEIARRLAKKWRVP